VGIMDFNGVKAGFDGSLHRSFEGSFVEDDVGLGHLLWFGEAIVIWDGARGIYVVRPAVQLRKISLRLILSSIGKGRMNSPPL